MKFKDIYNQKYVSDLAGAIQQVYPGLDRRALLAGVFDEEWELRELKQRMRHITLVLGSLLPADYGTALSILRQAAPSLSHFGFENMVFPDFVEVFGLDHWQASIPALEAFTQLISAEYAVRPFIVQDQERMMAQMLRWAHHESPDVRRLASEGCRPRLPWGIRLQALEANPAPILQILEALKDDPSESVRRSVANNLNDISKDNPEIVLDLARRWHADGGPEIEWIAKHALRTLVKKGHPRALALLGYGPAAIDVRNLAVEPAAIAEGGEVTFSFDLESLADEPQELMIDFVIHLVRARGQRTPKVFKLAKRTLQPREVLHIEKVFSFRPVTTRKYYPGEHAFQPQVNGTTYGSISFQVG
ncbi:MAG: DNA alkylation repair protein [Anaerolineae bacterium]|nr:DNA alkylation repair protein [Anaerolineae bacterium]